MRRVAIFDLDGTLVDSAWAIVRALDQLRNARGLPGLDIELARRWISLGAPALVGHALELENDATDEDIAAFRAAYANDLGTPEDLYPGIADALADLRKAGVVLGVCTNKPQILSEKVLKACGIASNFIAVIGGDATPHPKPDHRHLLHTIAAMGCSGKQFDFIGDSSIDAAAASAGGARFLWASWGYCDAEDLGLFGQVLTTPMELVSTILRNSPA